MRRIKKAKIRHISLVPKGANRLPVIYKSDGSVEFEMLSKANMEEGTITAIVYAPELRDSQNDIASAEVIKEMAYEYAKNGKGIDIRHDGTVISKDAAWVAEQFIVQKGDPRFADLKDSDGNPVDATDSWGMVLKIEDENLKKLYREGEWQGVSMGGVAEVEAEKEDATSLGRALINMLKSLTTGNRNEGELDMNAEELSKALKDNNAELAKTFTTILVEAGVIKKADDKPDDTKVSKEDKPKAKEAPVFKGELSDKAAVLAHKKALAIWKAEIEFADDPVALFERMEKIEEEFSSSKDLAKVDAEAGVEPGDSPEVRRLKRELAKEQRKSNQDTGDPTPDYSDGTTNLSKEDEDAVRAGVRAAKIARGENPDK